MNASSKICFCPLCYPASVRGSLEDLWAVQGAAASLTPCMLPPASHVRSVVGLCFFHPHLCVPWDTRVQAGEMDPQEDTAHRGNEAWCPKAPWADAHGWASPVPCWIIEQLSALPRTICFKEDCRYLIFTLLSSSASLYTLGWNQPKGF